MQAGKIIGGDFKVFSQCMTNRKSQRPLQVTMKPAVKYVALFSQIRQMNVSRKNFKAFIRETT